MASIQLCGPCNRISIEETLQDLFSKLKNPDSTVVGGQQESQQKTWHSNLPAVFESSIKCELCKLILEGLREGRRQLVEETRFSEDWAETPKDFEDDILTIPYYSNATPDVKILAWSADSFEKENMMSAIQDVDNRLRAHAIIRVTCSGGVDTVFSWDGYNEINCELRISSKNGNKVCPSSMESSLIFRQVNLVLMLILTQLFLKIQARLRLLTSSNFGSHSVPLAMRNAINTCMALKFYLLVFSTLVL